MNARRLLAATLLALLGCGGSSGKTDAGAGGEAGGRAGTGGAAGTPITGQGGGGNGGTLATAGSSGSGGAGHSGAAGAGGNVGTGGQAGAAGQAGAGGQTGAGGQGGPGGHAGLGGQGGAAGQTGAGGQAGAAAQGGAAGQAGAAGTAGAGGAGEPLQAVPVACTGCTAVRFDVDAEQMVFDPQRRQLYLTLAGAAPIHPNTVVTIDVATEAVAAVTPIGSNPNALALSDDASTLWVGVDGPLSVRKVTLTTAPPTVGPLVQVPQSSSAPFGSPATAASIAVLPGSATTIAVETFAGRYFGTYLLDDGVARTGNTSLDLIQATQIVPGPPGTFFGYNANDTGYEIFSYTASAAGLSQKEVMNLASGFGTYIVYDRNRLYATSGDIIDVSTPGSPIAAGKIGAGPIAIRDANRLLLILVGTSGIASPLQMYLMDRTTLEPVDVLTLPSEFPETTFGGGTVAFAYVGGSRVAILEAIINQTTEVTTRHLYLLDAPLVSEP